MASKVRLLEYLNYWGWRYVSSSNFMANEAVAVAC
jgi:hypothetical protein